MHILPTAFKPSKLQEERKKKTKHDRLENIKTERYQTQS